MMPPVSMMTPQIMNPVLKPLSGVAALSRTLPMTYGARIPADVLTAVPMARSAPRCAVGVISATMALLIT